MGDKRYTIGRESNNDIVIVDSSVSRLHAEIIVSGDGRKILISDCNSSNGTLLFRNNRQSAVTGAQQIFPEDKLQFGDIKMPASALFEDIRVNTNDVAIYNKELNIIDNNPQETKTCPVCSENIKQAAGKCRHCGHFFDKSLQRQDAPGGSSFCHNCGVGVTPGQEFCIKCGVRLVGGQHGLPCKSKLTAGLLGILLGSIGVHRFYLGYPGTGIIQIFVSLLTLGVGGLWGFIEGILILTGNMNRDAMGRPLI